MDFLFAIFDIFSGFTLEISRSNREVPGGVVTGPIGIVTGPIG